MKTTTLWFVGRLRDSDTILVSKKYAGQLNCMRIRTITGRAAGRKYKRDNLPSIIISIDEEWENVFSPYGNPEDQNEFRKKRNERFYRRQIDRFSIKVKR